MFREKVGLMQGPPPSPCYVPITSTLTNFSAFASEKPFGYYRAIIGCTILRLHLVIQYNVYVHVGQSRVGTKTYVRHLGDSINITYSHYPVPYTPLSYDKEMSLSSLPCKHKTTDIGIKMPMFTIGLYNIQI